MNYTVIEKNSIIHEIFRPAPKKIRKQNNVMQEKWNSVLKTLLYFFYSSFYLNIKKYCLRKKLRMKSLFWAKKAFAETEVAPLCKLICTEE